VPHGRLEVLVPAQVLNFAAVFLPSFWARVPRTFRRIHDVGVFTRCKSEATSKLPRGATTTPQACRQLLSACGGSAAPPPPPTWHHHPPPGQGPTAARAVQEPGTYPNTRTQPAPSTSPPLTTNRTDALAPPPPPSPHILPPQKSPCLTSPGQPPD